jgi:phage I-like protein
MVELLATTGKTTTADAMEVIRAWKKASDSVPDLHKKYSELSQTIETDKKEAIISAGMKAGTIPPAFADVMRTMTLSQVEAWAKTAQPTHLPGRTPAREPATLSSALSDDDKLNLRSLGITEDAFMKEKQRLGR